MAVKKNQQTNWISITLSLLPISIALALIWSAFLWSDFCNSLVITQINLGKTNVLESREYEKSLYEIIGKNPDQVRLNHISDLMESHPYVKAARVSHQFPGIIQIEIMEREPIAILKSQPMVMLDADGVVLPDLNNLGDFNLPILTNFNPEPKLYPVGKRALSVKVKECINWLSRIQVDYESLYNNLSEMKMTSTNDLELILSDHPTRIYLGQDRLWSRFKILKQFELELGQKKISDYTYLDMRYENQIIAKGRRS
tara:strand:- start:1140 stop:1907 length:768 start_codon:yes stop_codon:yes gene_type:complete